MAGIKVWMLTGDKGETALKIGLNSGMFNGEEAQMLEIDGTEKSQVKGRLRSCTKLIGRNEREAKHGLAISGNAFDILHDEEDLAEDLSLLFSSCEAVIVYRATPKQKAEIVNYIR